MKVLELVPQKQRKIDKRVSGFVRHLDLSISSHSRHIAGGDMLGSKANSLRNDDSESDYSPNTAQNKAIDKIIEEFRLMKQPATVQL